MKAYNRFSHMAYNIALSLFILSCIPKYLHFEGSNFMFISGCCLLSSAFVIKAFELPNK